MHTPRRALILGTAAAALLVATAPAGALAADQTVTFDTAGEHAFTVPAGVHRLSVELVGAAGGSGWGTIGGRGAAVMGSVPVSGGPRLYAEVGGAGASNGTPTFSGGFNGGGNGAGGGGGASDVRTIPAGVGGSLASRLMVAGGGGGGALWDGSDPTTTGRGGDAGTAGLDAIAGGQPGGVSAGGAGGPGRQAGKDGDPGSLGTGGDALGSNWNGGGGGGGYYGGGGGGGTGPCRPCGQNGGGGGGSSLVPPGGTSALAAAGAPPLVRLTYELPAAQPSASALAFAPTATGAVSAGQTVTIANPASDTDLVVSGLSLDSDDFAVAASTCQGTLAPGESCTLRVRFAPTATGARSATLRLAGNAPLNLALSGTGTDPAPPAAGPQGAAGPRGAAARLALVHCHQRRCAVTFAGAAPTGRVTLTRGRTTYATGHGRTLTTRRKVKRGAYTLRSGRSSWPAIVT